MSSSEVERDAARNLIDHLVEEQDRRDQSGETDEPQDDETEQEQETEAHPYTELLEPAPHPHRVLIGEMPNGYVDPVKDAMEQYGQIPDEMIDEWKEMFSLFDFDKNGFILCDDLGSVLRGMGRNLTEATISRLINTYDTTGSGKLDFPAFYRIMTENAPMPGPCTEEKVMRDFKVFDLHNDGYIPVSDLVHLLRNLGEPLTRDDVEHLMQEIYIDGDNRVNIKDFVQHMFRTSAPSQE